MAMSLDHAQGALREWMLRRQWHRLQAKRDPFRQSLLAHALSQVNVVASLAPLLTDPDGAALRDEDILVLLAAVASHDVGKETPEWQAYVERRSIRVGHVDPVLAHKAARELVELLGLTEVAEIVSGITLHMTATSGGGDVLVRALTGGHTNRRWRELADWAAQIDNLCSAADVDLALIWARRPGGLLGRCLAWTRHRVRVIRGVSTTLLHRAALDSYTAVGWLPILTYADSTLYAAPKSNGATEPLVSDLTERAASVFQEALDKADLINEVVGSPIADMFPKPELFHPRLMPAYLERALMRSKSANFRKKTLEVIARIRTRMQNESLFSETVARELPADDAELRQILASSTPLAEAFRFFKAVFCTDKLASWPAEHVKVLAARFDATFGDGAFQALVGLSTQMPARDYLLTRRFFRIEAPEGVLVSSLPESRQAELCVELLTQLAEVVLEPGREMGLLTPLDGGALAKTFLADLIAATDAETMLESYAGAKTAGPHRTTLCPITNETSTGAAGGGSDLGLSRDAHTNRWPIQRSGLDTVTVSTATRREMMLRRFALGEVPDRILAIVPPFQLGRHEAQALVDRALAIGSAFHESALGDRASATQRYSLGLTGQIARRLDRSDARDVPDDLLGLLSYSVSPDRGTEHRKSLRTELLKLTGAESLAEGDDAEQEALRVLNDEYLVTPYASFDEAVNALYHGADESAAGALGEDPDLADLRARALKLRAPARVVCRTPHAVYLLIQGQIGLNPKEKEASRAVRELLLLMLFATGLGGSVAILEKTESFTFSGGEGAVRLPASPALREVVFEGRRRLLAHGRAVGFGPDHVTHEWLGIRELDTWLAIVVAAHGLADIENDRRQPVFERNNALYHALSARSAGFLLRQVEQRAGRSAVARALPHIEALELIL